ncbi:hypothetical protein FNV65_40950 [Streptomyces sp. S1A1-8]|uniref:hypothetical protein n=1 Tax=Streptomyces TaxID=1883 RepID=UPI001165043F|nr:MULTISPECIES: hypothetical protein [Streptomyces]KAF5993697.1 hypothetical protein BOG92_019590 [Streptomyces sp. WAC00263]MCX4426537.1 hypothetical protein [Streptomyces mirabilis]QDO01742.1 hypothetical protein FNV58_42365 [Streptomyces sp. RLB1-9]QDO23474.1 hypothetical protein FNV65_40950 [Streptomyces sp. S1A1-8]QDO33600.1 hypothetical protein FNV63_40975 [Streptomyces sp. S1A1-3]
MNQPPHDEPTAASPEELREQVEQTRTGQTVEALAEPFVHVMSVQHFCLIPAGARAAVPWRPQVTRAAC